MKHFYSSKKQGIADLIFQYEVMSQKGTVFSLEETEFKQILDFYESEQATDKALQIVEQALGQHPYSGELLLRKARYLVSSNQSEKAIEILDDAESLGHTLKDTDLLRAQALGYLRHYQEALGILYDLKFRHYLSRKELSDVLFQEAWIHEKLENFDRMYETLREALLENRSNHRALERIWIAVELCRKYQESIVLHHHVLDEDPYSYQAWFNLGHAYYSCNDYENAIKAFEYAFLINEKFELAYRDYGEVCFELKQYRKALNCYLEYMEQFDADSDLLAKVGECYEYLGKINKAKIYFFRALGLDQRNDEVYFHIGECYAKEGHLGSAIHFYKQAIRLDSRREDYLVALADVYLQMDKPRKALPLLRQATEIAPEETTYWIKYASYFLKTDQLEKAHRILTQALQNSFGADLHYCMSACLFGLNCRKEALHELGEGLMENFEAHSIFFQFAAAYQEDRDVKAIIRYYKGE
ncbi:MAG: tetratricopeptide repeat protein [Bacteroidota bacterium]